jgi:hypothetical protein
VTRENLLVYAPCGNRQIPANQFRGKLARCIYSMRTSMSRRLLLITGSGITPSAVFIANPQAFYPIIGSYSHLSACLFEETQIMWYQFSE